MQSYITCRNLDKNMTFVKIKLPTWSCAQYHSCVKRTSKLLVELHAVVIPEWNHKFGECILVNEVFD